MSFEHKSVLLRETVEGLRIKPEGTYVDGTLGGGGHAFEVSRHLSDLGSIIGIDQDDAAIAAAESRLGHAKCHVRVIRSNYGRMREVLSDMGISRVDGILLDLGVSSYQLDTPERGFTYREDVRLDMRMDLRNDCTAEDIVNQYSEEQLYRIIRDYGEEKFAGRIAAKIAETRKIQRITTTGQLSDIIREAMPMKALRTAGHPAKKTFQAIRIELNRELYVLENSLDDMIDLLSPGGRICVITFHSLEDRIVKNIFRKNENPCTCPPDFPICVCGKLSKGQVITRKPIAPGEEELRENRRAASAKLRIFERNSN